MNLPIRVRMTLWYSVLLALIIACVGAFLVVRLRTDLVAAIDRTLGPATAQISLGYHAEGARELRDVSGTVLSGERAAAQVIAPGGHVVVHYGDPTAERPLLSAKQQAVALAGTHLAVTVTVGPGAGRFRAAAQPTAFRGRRGVVVAAQSLDGVDRSVHRLLILLLIAGPAALLATAAGGWWLARRALMPIERLRSGAQDISVTRLDERLGVPSSRDEVAALATTLNTMLARIQQGVDEQHRIVADASHELRSPLAAMRSELDVTLRADQLPAAARHALESTRDDVDQLSRTVDDLLTLASADARGLQLDVELVDVRQIAATTVQPLRSLARERGVEIVVEGPEAFGMGDHRRLRQAIGNVIDNAIRHSPDGHVVRVRTTATSDVVIVTVLDDGPGIPEDLCERVFDRFFRIDAARTPSGRAGGGIGLSITREIAIAHGGRVWVEARPNGGCEVSISLPAADHGSRP